MTKIKPVFIFVFFLMLALSAIHFIPNPPTPSIAQSGDQYDQCFWNYDGGDTHSYQCTDVHNNLSLSGSATKPYCDTGTGFCEGKVNNGYYVCNLTYSNDSTILQKRFVCNWYSWGLKGNEKNPPSEFLPPCSGLATQSCTPSLGNAKGSCGYAPNNAPYNPGGIGHSCSIILYPPQPTPSPSPCPSPKPVANPKLSIVEDEDSHKICFGQRLADQLGKIYPFSTLSIEVIKSQDATMQCVTDADGIIDCNDPALINASSAPVIASITSQAGGRANAIGSIIHLSTNNNVSTFIHEFGHIAHLADEYKPSDESEQNSYCNSSINNGENVSYFTKRNGYTEASAQSIAKSVPWSKWLNKSIPLTNGEGGLGTPTDTTSDNVLGLYYNDRCDPLLDGVKPHKDSIMGNTTTIPPYHLYVIVKKINELMGTDIPVDDPSDSDDSDDEENDGCRVPTSTPSPGTRTSPRPTTSPTPC